MTPEALQRLGTDLDDTSFVIGGAILAIEVTKGVLSGTLRWRGALDMLASVSTQLPSLLVEVLVLSVAYRGYVWVSEALALWQMPLTPGTVVLAVVAADFAYYWEHRFAHEWRALWTQHAVHHSSRFMNTTVAIRFGPFEGIASAAFHLPLLFLGFSPAHVFFGILVVLAYQTWIHTELVGRLGVLEGFLNTPSNHRVHHGCDEKYIDKNYGGISMLWDRLFGTYQREEETPRYGLKRDFDSVNPLLVWFSEFPELFRDLSRARSLRARWAVLFGRPGANPREGWAADQGSRGDPSRRPAGARGALPAPWRSSEDPRG